MAYPVGERHGGSVLTLIGVIAGCLVLYRRRQTKTLTALVAPFGLGLIAAFLGRYPYGGAPRIMLYTSPSICLLVGFGIGDLLYYFQGKDLQRRALLGILTGLAILGGALMIRDVVQPYRVLDDLRTRDFARWFWTGQGNGELACLKSDLGWSVRPRLWDVGMSAVYLFHQRMFSDRHRQRRSVDLDPGNYSRERPLRLVAFDRLPEGVVAFDRWLAALDRSFRVRRTETYVIQRGKPGEDWLRDAYDVLELVPRERVGTVAQEAAAIRTGRPL